MWRTNKKKANGLGRWTRKKYPAVDDDEVMLNVLGCRLTYYGQAETNAEAGRFNNSLRPRKPEGSLGRTAQDVHLNSHTAPELSPAVDEACVAIF